MLQVTCQLGLFASSSSSCITGYTNSCICTSNMWQSCHSHESIEKTKAPSVCVCNHTARPPSDSPAENKSVLFWPRAPGSAGRIVPHVQVVCSLILNPHLISLIQASMVAGLASIREIVYYCIFKIYYMHTVWIQTHFSCPSKMWWWAYVNLLCEYNIMI